MLPKEVVLRMVALLSQDLLLVRLVHSFQKTVFAAKSGGQTTCTRQQS